MATPDFIHDDDSWDKADAADGYTYGTFDDEPRVRIPELLEEHKTAIIVSAAATTALIAGIAARRLISRKEKE